MEQVETAEVAFGLYRSDEGHVGVGIACEHVEQRRHGVNIAWNSGRSRFYDFEDMKAYKIEIIKTLEPRSEFAESDPVTDGVPAAEPQVKNDAPVVDQTEYAKIGVDAVSSETAAETEQPNTEVVKDTAFENEWIREQLTKNLEAMSSELIKLASADGMKIQHGQIAAIRNELTALKS